MICWGWPPQMPYCWPVRTAKVRQASRTGQVSQMAMASAWSSAAVGEERVVVGRDHVTAGGLVTPAPDLGHAARPPCGHATRATHRTMGVAGAASVGLMARASGPPGGGCRRDRRDRWGSADASGFASGMQRDRVESEGSSGTNYGLSLLLRRHVAGSDGP